MSEERKTITIRGVDKSLYERISDIARQMGITIGEVINDALRKYLTFLENIQSRIEKELDELIQKGEAILIKDIKSLTISRKDLEHLDKKVIFRDINDLTFSDDVDDKLFNEKVLKIIRVSTISIPKTMSTILVSSKCERVGKIEVRS